MYTDIDQPVNKYRSHIFCDLCLPTHKIWRWAEFLFTLKHHARKKFEMLSRKVALIIPNITNDWL